jgi:hypothetical protein
LLLDKITDKLSLKSEIAGKTIQKVKPMTIDPEDMTLETTDTLETFLSDYMKSDYDSYRSAYGDTDYDSDNYGYDY